METLKALVRSRKVWVAAVGLAVVVAVQLGVSEEAANQISTAVLALAAAVIGGIAIEDGASKINTTPPTGDAPKE